MRKLVLACMLAIGVAGCNPQTLAAVQTALQFSTVGVNNPVTREQLYVVENSMIVIFAGLNAYKRSCRDGILPASCRVNIAKIQVHTRRIPGMLTSVRRFVRENDQVNAAVAFKTLVELINAAKLEATAAGVPING